MSIANYLTFIRVFISPIFLLVYLQHEWLGISWLVLPYILITLLTLSELSDACDGYLARKYNQVTDLGKILDPMADSISRISMFLTFTQGPVGIPLILVFVFIYRDSVVSTLRTVCALRGFALAARPSGKVKAVLQAIVVFCILILLIPFTRGHLSQERLHEYSMLLVTLAAAYSLFSGADYIYANRDYIKKLITMPKR